MLRRFVGVSALTAVALAATPFAGTAVALDDPVVVPADGATVGPRPVISATYDAPLNTTLSTIRVVGTPDEPGEATPEAGAQSFSNGNTTISFTPTGSLAEDENPYTVTVVAVPADPATGGAPNETVWEFSVDATAPAIPNALQLTPARSNGAVAVSGKTDPNTPVSVHIANVTAPDATATAEGTSDASGDFTLADVAIAALADGPIRATVTAADAYGNAAAATVDGVKDTVAPVRATILPTDGGTAKTRNTVVATYDEALGATSSMTVRNGVGNAIGGVTSLSEDGRTMTFTASSPLTTLGGVYQVTANAVDLAGNASTASSTFSIDDTAPGAPSVALTNPINLANQAAAVVSGTAEPGSTVDVSVDDLTAGSPVTGSAVAHATSGAYSVTVDVTPLADEQVTATATATDGAGNVSLPTVSAASAKDTVAPAAPAVDLTSPVAANRATTVSGTTEPGNAVAITVDDADATTAPVVASATAGPEGAYSAPLTLAGLADGTVTASVVSTDAAGNPSPAGTDTATLDSGLPDVPTLSMPTVNDANKASVVASGTAEPGSAVTVTVSDGVNPALSQVATAAGDTGAYSTAFDTTGLDDGTLTVTATAADAAGNVSGARTIGVARDTAVPNAPAVVLPAYVNDAGKGAVEASGTAEPGTIVNLTLSDADAGTADVVTTAVAAPTGSWAATVDLAGLADGGITASATATDGAGNTSPAGTATAQKDTVAPAAPVVSLTDPIDPANVATSAVSGTAEAASTVNVSVDDTDAATAAVTGSGPTAGTAYSIPVDLTSLADGAITATATATDAAGNTSAAASSAASAKDTTALALASTAPAGGSTVVPPATVSATYNEALSPTLTTITVSDSTASLLSGTTTFANGGRTVVFTPADGLADAGSPYTVTLAARDADGSDSLPGTFSFSVDGVAPVAPGVAFPASVNAATYRAVAVSGVTEPGTSVTVTVDDATAGSPVTKTVGSDPATGAYATELDLLGLAEGPLSVQAVASDLAGNTSPATPTTSTLDITAPEAPSLTLPAWVNDANKAAVPVSGVAEPGSSVAIAVDDATPGSPVTAVVATDATTGAYSTTLDLSGLADGALSGDAVASDAALNPSPAGPATSAKDVGVPGAPTVVVADPVNVANTTQVPVSGVAEPGSTVDVSIDDATAGDPVTKSVTAAGDTGEYATELDVTSLADGPITASVTATDAAGNVSPATAQGSTKDSTIPDVPTIDTPLAVTRANYQAATFDGTAEPGAQLGIAVAEDGADPATVGSFVFAGENGLWTATYDLSSLADGPLHITVLAADAAGNTSQTAAHASTTKNITRAFTIDVPAAPVSGAAQSVTVTARQTYVTSSPVDETYTGTPVLTTEDGHSTAGTCGPAVAGVATCTGTVFGDLGPQTLRATEGTGSDLVEGTRAVTVQPTGLVYTAAPPATAVPNQQFTITVTPTAGVTGASIDGYAATRKLVVTGGGSVPASGSTLDCPAAACSVTMSFVTRGTKTVAVTDNGTPALSTPAATVAIPFGTVLSLARSRLVVNTGSTVTLAGELTNTSTLGGVGGRRIVLYRRTAPSTEYRAFTSVLTAANGTWSKQVRLYRNTTYQARFAGDAGHIASQSTARMVKAAQVVTSTWSKSGRTVKVTGKVSPNAAGRTIYLQYRKSDGSWAYAGAKATVRSTGSYSMSRTFRTGRYVLRAAISATSVNSSGYSASYTLR